MPWLCLLHGTDFQLVWIHTAGLWSGFLLKLMLSIKSVAIWDQGCRSEQEEGFLCRFVSYPKCFFVVVSMQSHSVPIVTCDYVCPLVWMTLCVSVINSALYASLSHKNIFCISKTSAKYTKPNANDSIPLYSHFMDIILHVQAQQWGFVLLSWSGQCLNRATHC